MSNIFSFLQYRKIAIVFSILLILTSIVSLATRSLNVGLDFTGGTVVEVNYESAVTKDEVEKVLDANGYTGAVIQHMGSVSSISIRLPTYEGKNNDEVGDKVFNALGNDRSDASLSLKGYVGPVVGEELRDDGGLAMLVALLCIMAYVAIRFEWKFAVGSVTALIHDVIVVLGFFSITQIEFDLTVLAAILAVIGYSLNDTIVVYDRIRENFLRMRKGTALEVMDRSLNQTLSRTIITSLTTLLVLTALYIFGGALINSFAIALIVGVFIGTYSSIYVASVAALALGVEKEDLMPPEIDKEGAEQDALM